MEQSEQSQQSFDEYAILEVMGKTRLGGRVREQTIFGVPMIRIDIPDGQGGFKATKFYHPNSLFCLTPVGEKEAVAVALYNDAPPVTRWEMSQKALPEGSSAAIDAEAFSDRHKDWLDDEE